MLPRLARGAEQVSPGAESTRLLVHTADGSGTVEVVYSIVPAYRGRGLASQATRALIHHALSHPDIRYVIAGCLDDNLASLKVLEKLGMRRVGRAGGTLRFELRGR